MEGLTQLEQAVLKKLLAGENPTLAALRAQAEGARLKSRENTGAGFFCYFDVPSEAKPVGEGSFHLGDVDAVIPPLAHGAGFVLFITSGKLDRLEGYSYDEPWPADIQKFELRYQGDHRQLNLPSVADR